MKVEYRDDRFDRKTSIPHYKIYSNGTYDYYIAFKKGDFAYITDCRHKESKNLFEFEPSNVQKRIAIQQIFFKLQGLIDN